MGSKRLRKQLRNYERGNLGMVITQDQAQLRSNYHIFMSILHSSIIYQKLSLNR